MAEKKVTTTQGPDNQERERISKKLFFLAAVLGEGIDLNENDCIGVMHILNELADAVFPEGAEQPSNAKECAMPDQYHVMKIRLDNGEELTLEDLAREYPHWGFEEREDGRYVVPDARKPQDKEEE